MRLLALFPLGLVLFVTGCAGSRPYTVQDLRQVRRGYATIEPTYVAFRRAYLSNNRAGISKYYDREQRQCKLVDQIDARDTIDPSVSLFQASAALDDFCNTIETAYATWASANHLPYDKALVSGTPSQIFVGMDLEAVTIPSLLQNPTAIPRSTPVG